MKEFTLEKSLNLPFVGSAPADELTFTQTLVALDERLSGDGLAVMILKMKVPFFFGHYVHCLPTNTAFTVTRSETMKRVVWEINGQDAAAYYAKTLGLSGVDKFDSGVYAKNPFGVKIVEIKELRKSDEFNRVFGGTNFIGFNLLGFNTPALCGG
jgi:hypothetical protein